MAEQITNEVNGMSDSKTEIQCPYCDGIWDYKIYDKCPNCGAVPDLNQIDEARRREIQQIRQRMKAESIRNPSRAISIWVASKLKLWVICALILIIVPPAIFITMFVVPKQRPSVELQKINDLNIISHAPNETINLADYLSVEVTEPDALLLKNSSISAFIPDSRAILIIKASIRSSEMNHSIYELKKHGTEELFSTPYIITNNTAYMPVDDLDIRNLDPTEPELRNAIEMNPRHGITSESGYLCYIVPKDIKDCVICFEDVHYTNQVCYIDRVHEVKLNVKEVE